MAWKFDQVFLPDLSHFEYPVDFNMLAGSGCIAVVWKATQGQSMHDPTYAEARSKAKQSGLLWGAYHFGDGTAVDGQVNNFLDFALPAETDLIALDFEDYTSSMSLEQAKEWITEVETQLHRANEVVLYSGNRIKESLGSNKDPFWSAHRLWLAHYSETPTWPPAWGTYWLHQFTDGNSGPPPHTVQGVTGPCDVNSYQFSEAQLKVEWAAGRSLPPLAVIPSVPKVVPVEHKVIVIAPPGVKIIVITDPRLT